MINNVLVCLFAIAAASPNTHVRAEDQQTTELVATGITIAKELIPIIGGLIKKSKKEYRQVACWVATTSCYKDAAQRIQDEIFQGRDGFSVESFGQTGAWVSYWRVRTAVTQDQTIASDTCEDGSQFAVFNCQTTGTVHC